MRAPENRRVMVVGYAVSTALGHGLQQTWQRAAAGRSGAGWLTRFSAPWVESSVVGEIPDLDLQAYAFIAPKARKAWNARYVLASTAVCADALAHAGVELRGDLAERTGNFIGSAISGADAYDVASDALAHDRPLRVSPYLLPNICSNVPAGVTGMHLGYTGPVVAACGACATGNHSLALGARLIQTGDADMMLVGGVDFPLTPPVVAGFQNMNATYKTRHADRGTLDPKQASRPFSADARGFVLAEGVGVLLLAAEEVARAHGLRARAEVLGVAMTSDAHHVTKPHGPTIVRCIQEALDDAGLAPADIDTVNCHGTSTQVGDRAEIDCLRQVFGEAFKKTPITSNKSQVGHSLGATAAIEAILAIEGMQRGVILPTLNLARPQESDDVVDVVSGPARRVQHETVLSNAFGFGGTNCCVVLKSV